MQSDSLDGNGSFPSMVVVSINNTCNYACPHCYYPAYVERNDYSVQNMGETVFRRIADEVSQHPRTALRLIGWGEPLLHPNIIQFVEYMHGVGPENAITLITNGYLLTPDRSLALMRAGLDLVEVSLDAFHEETYSRRRKSRSRDAFSRVKSNVHAMMAQRNEHGFRTRVALSFIEEPAPESEREFRAFRATWSDVVDDIVKRPQHTFKGTLREHRALPTARRACRGLFARCDVTPWGEISVCYNDWERTDLLGDLNDAEASIADIWHGLLLRRLQVGQLGGDFVGICETCKDYNPDAWLHPYEEVIKRAVGVEHGEP